MISEWKCFAHLSQVMFQLCNFWRQNISTKCKRKMLMTLTLGLFRQSCYTSMHQFCIPNILKVNWKIAFSEKWIKILWKRFFVDKKIFVFFKLAIVSSFSLFFVNVNLHFLPSLIIEEREKKIVWKWFNKNLPSEFNTHYKSSQFLMIKSLYASIN